MNHGKNGETPKPTDRGVTPERQRGNMQAGVDYFTATSTDDSVGQQWLGYFNTHKKVSIDTGSKVCTKYQWGFDMVFINGLTWGYSNLGRYLMTASSENAHSYWRKVLPIASNISRLDLHFTFVAKCRGDDLVEKAYKDIKNNGKGHLTSEVIMNSRGGQTLYLGSRKSDQFGRFYYKTAQAPLDYPTGTYRLEVEYKKPRSFAMFSNMLECMKKGTPVPKMIKDTVITWFLARGLKIDYNSGGDVIPTQVSKTMTSDKKKIRWLRTAVAPSLVDLCGRQEFEKLAPALGLTKYEFEQLALFAPDIGQPVSLT